jgi:hypothetical protein
MEKQCVCLEVGTEFDWNRVWSTRRDQPLCPEGQTLVHPVILDCTIHFISNKATSGTSCRWNVAAGGQAGSRSCDHVRYLFPSHSLLVQNGSSIPKPHERQKSQIIRTEPHCRKLGFIVSNDRLITVESTRARVRISAKQNAIFFFGFFSLLRPMPGKQRQSSNYHLLPHPSLLNAHITLTKVSEHSTEMTPIRHYKIPLDTVSVCSTAVPQLRAPPAAAVTCSVRLTQQHPVSPHTALTVWSLERKKPLFSVR